MIMKGRINKLPCTVNCWQLIISLCIQIRIAQIPSLCHLPHDWYNEYLGLLYVQDLFCPQRDAKISLHDLFRKGIQTLPPHLQEVPVGEPGIAQQDSGFAICDFAARIVFCVWARSWISCRPSGANVLIMFCLLASHPHSVEHILEKVWCSDLASYSAYRSKFICSQARCAKENMVGDNLAHIGLTLNTAWAQMTSLLFTHSL